MKILHIIFTIDLGGAEHAVISIAKAQRALGHDIRVLIRPQKKAKESIKNWLKAENLQFAEVGWFLQKWHIQKHVDIFKPDILHAHLGNACKALKNIDKICPAVATLHMDYKPKQHAHLDGVMAVNETQLSRIQALPLKRKFSGKMAAIPLPISGKVPAKRKNDKNLSIQLKNEYKIQQKYILGSVGRLHAKKGVAHLVKSFLETQFTDKNGNDVTENVGLVIVGDGEERAALEVLADRHKRVYLVGRQVDVTPWYKLFDVYISNSEAETFGLTLLEAMQAGCKILSTKTAGAEALLRNQKLETRNGVQWIDNDLADKLAVLRFPVGRAIYDVSRFDVRAVGFEIIDFYEVINV